MTAFDSCLAIILQAEGGYVNDKLDPGGRTNLGVTQRVWEAWIGKPATEADMRALTPALVGPVYRKNYWDALHCDDLPPALALCLFDFGVNAGVKRAARYLQTMVDATPDGMIGPVAVAEAKSWIAAHGLAQAVRMYQRSRRSYYRMLATFPRFGRGWLARCDEVERQAMGMIP